MTTNSAETYRLPRFFLAVFFLSFLVFTGTLFPGSRPAPLRFFFNLSPTAMTAARAAELPAMSRWVSAGGRVDPRSLYYMYKTYGSSIDKRGCESYLLGRFVSRGRPLPFRALVRRDPAKPCAKDATVPVADLDGMPLNFAARLVPGDVSMHSLFAMQGRDALERLLAQGKPGTFTGMLRTRGFSQFPRKLTGGGARCWLDVEAAPEFLCSIMFFAMVLSAAGAGGWLMIMRRRKTCLKPE